MNNRIRLTILILTTVVLLVAAFLGDPIQQPLSYHQFADQDSVPWIPHTWNVLSNIPFVIVGLLGMVVFKQQGDYIREAGIMNIVRLFFIGLVLTGFGSGYYHLDPTNATLVWDRIPMTISFMSFFCFILAMHIQRRVGAALLWPLLGLGLVSVLYWIYTESIGAGDLRFYLVIQFLPMVLIPLVMILFPTKAYRSSFIWLVILFYFIAKVLELYDHQIDDVINIGGHILKHVVASLAGLAFIKAVVSVRRVKDEKGK